MAQQGHSVKCWGCGMDIENGWKTIMLNEDTGEKEVVRLCSMCHEDTEGIDPFVE